MTRRASRLAERIYALLVDRYPRRFREQFGDPMKQTFRDLLDDPDMPTSRIWLSVLRDLRSSLLREQLTDLTGGRLMSRLPFVARALRVAVVVVLIGATPLATGFAGYYLGRSQAQPVAGSTPPPDQAAVERALSRLSSEQVRWVPIPWIACPVAVAPGDPATVTIFFMNTGGEARCPVFP